MELRHLRYLIAVAEEKSFVAAAARLQLAQPALSRQIHDLEDELGAELFLREPSGTRLTAAGEQCVRTARQILDDVSAAIQHARLAERGLVGRCVVGAGRYPLWNGLLAGVVEQARKDYPGIDVVVQEYASENAQWQALASAEIDIGFGTAPPADSMQFSVETHSLDILDAIVVARNHPLASRTSIALKDLDGETWIRYAPGFEDEATRSFQSVLSRVGFVPHKKRLAANADALRMLVRSGAGWSALPRSLRGGLNTGLVTIPLEDLAVPFRYVHMHRRGDKRPAVHSILRAIRRTAQRDATSPAAEPPSGIRLMVEPEEHRYASRLELRHLRYFAAMVEHESIGRAAEALDLTQPALSRQLRDLEGEIGLPLFTRTSRGVVPTLAGEALAREIRSVLRMADGLASEAQRAVRCTAGGCVVGVVTSPLVWDTVTRAVADCAARLPAIDVRLEDVPTPRQSPALREARIDVGLGHRYPAVPNVDPNVVRVTLLPDMLNMALVSRRHPLAGRRELCLRDLTDVPFLFMKRAFSAVFHDHVMSMFARAGYIPRVDGEYDGLPTVWALAAQGLGWCLGSDSQRAYAPDGCVAIRLVDFEMPWGCELVYRRDESSAPVLEFIAAMRRAASEIAAGMASQENEYWSPLEVSA